MPLPAYGALGHTLIASRILQLCVLITTIGLTSHCISELSEESINPSGSLISYLCLACLGTVYSAFTIVLYIDSALPFHYTAVCDAVFLIAYIIISVFVGEHIALASCRAMGAANLPDGEPGDNERLVLSSIGKGSFDGKVGTAPRIVKYRRNALMTPGEIQQHRYESWLHKMEIKSWIQENKQGCEIFKASWALALVGSVLFLVSTAACVGLWWKLKKQAKQDRRRDSKLSDIY